ASFPAKLTTLPEDRNGGTQNRTPAGSDGNGASGVVSSSTVTSRGRSVSSGRPASWAIQTFTGTDDSGSLWSRFGKTSSNKASSVGTTRSRPPTTASPSASNH